MAKKSPRNPSRKPPRRKNLRPGGRRPQTGERRTNAARGLPEIGVIEIAAIDIDGDLRGRPIIGNRPYKEDVIVITQAGAPALGLGERALVRFARSEAGGWEARVIRALDTAPDRVVGIYRLTPEGGRIEPTDRKQRREFRVARSDSKEARDGEIVLATLKPSASFGLPEAQIIERIGDSSNPRAFSLIAIYSHDIPTEFPPEALRLAEAAQPVPLRARDDLRTIPLVTIDGADARDFDDAVWAEPDPEPHRRDRRCRLVCPAKRCPRPRSREPRQFRLLPRSRRADAARGAVERVVLAQAGRRPRLHGGASLVRRPRPCPSPSLRPGADALGRAAHLRASSASY
jgi:exoribonuclease R